MMRVVALLQSDGGAEHVEWWAPAPNGNSLRLEIAEGEGAGRRTGISLAPVGALVIIGAWWPLPLTQAVVGLVPVLRRRWTEERLAHHATLLARRVEALDDFAALVAHELKAPLQAGLLAGDAAAGAARALELVDSVLEAIRSESLTHAWSSPRACLDDAASDLGGVDAEIVATLPDSFPMPAAALRLVLRNLLANALAAGAQNVRVSAFATASQWTLVVDDDGVGLEAPAGYVAGSRLGLGLCRRLVARLGGTIELAPRRKGGTRATLVLGRSETP
jgi:signal transduction histidine kinase